MEQSGDSCEVATALKSIDLNSTKENALISTEEKTGCFLCQNPDPIKKCSKSHSRCKGNFFCDKNCELSFHKSEKTKVCTYSIKSFVYTYSDLPKNHAANLIIFWGKKHLHKLIRTYTFIDFGDFSFKT